MKANPIVGHPEFECIHDPSCLFLPLQLEEDRSETAQQRGGLLASAKNSFQVIIGRMDGLWVKFIPMVSLFFCMAFINTIVDNMKDTIVITAVGSGPSVIPFLTGIWPPACTIPRKPVLLRYLTGSPCRCLPPRSLWDSAGSIPVPDTFLSSITAISAA